MSSLAEAEANYNEALGFTLFPSGRHEQYGTENSGAWFADNSYLELLTYFDKLRIIDLGKVYIKYPKHDEIYYMFKCQPTEHPGSVKISFDEHKGFTWVTP